jgi:hypothetical protein
MTVALNTGVPSAPLVDPVSGQVTPAWRAFLIALYQRTGGAVGQSSDTSELEAQLAAETAARSTADTGLATGLASEAATRAAADTALDTAVTREATLRARADSNEATARQNADALLVPIAQLCSMWAACDLSFLPTADPGSGMPWLDGTHIAVGTSATAVVGIGKEDGTGRWGLEDGTGAWTWG